jgi:hypothetical protein
MKNQILFLILFVTLSLSCFAESGGSVTDFGGGTIIPMANVSVLASATGGGYGYASGTYYHAIIPDYYDKNNEWDGATFTSSISQTVMVDYSALMNYCTFCAMFITYTKNGGSAEQIDQQLSVTPNYTITTSLSVRFRSVFSMEPGDKFCIVFVPMFTNALSDRLKTRLQIYRIK